MLYKSKFNILFEEIMKNLICEGGHAVNNVTGILKENIKPTIDYFEQLVFIPLNILKNEWTAELGSVGKKDISGDIDIAINTTEIANRLNLTTSRDVLVLIKEKLLENNCEVRLTNGENASLNCAFPIQGINQENQYVQIDLFQSSALNFVKFSKYAPMQGTSKYKGGIRGDLIGIIAKVLTWAAENNQLPEKLPENFINKPYTAPNGVVFPGSVFSYDSFTDNGLMKKTATWIGKRGNYNQSINELSKKLISNDPQEMIDKLFGTGKYTIDDFNSFESIWNNVLFDQNFPYPEKRDEIINYMYNDYKFKHKEIPSEIVNYVEK